VFFSKSLREAKSFFFSAFEALSTASTVPISVFIIISKVSEGRIAQAGQ
jgi:hypothetical protein